MKFSVVTLPQFDRQLKHLVKKYPSLKEEYAALIDQLEQNPRKGTPIGNGCFKIRLSIASKGRGKSGGARVITHLYVEDRTVFLLAIYDKNEQTDISNKELGRLLAGIE